MERKFWFPLVMVLVLLLGEKALTVANSLEPNIHYPEHAAAGKKIIVKVSVIKNNTQEENQKLNEVELLEEKEHVTSATADYKTSESATKQTARISVNTRKKDYFQSENTLKEFGNSNGDLLKLANILVSKAKSTLSTHKDVTEDQMINTSSNNGAPPKAENQINGESDEMEDAKSDGNSAKDTKHTSKVIEPPKHKMLLPEKSRHTTTVTQDIHIKAKHTPNAVGPKLNKEEVAKAGDMPRSILKEANNPEKKNDVHDDLTKQKENSDGADSKLKKLKEDINKLKQMLEEVDKIAGEKPKTKFSTESPEDIKQSTAGNMPDNEKALTAKQLAELLGILPASADKASKSSADVDDINQIHREQLVTARAPDRAIKSKDHKQMEHYALLGKSNSNPKLLAAKLHNNLATNADQNNKDHKASEITFKIPNRDQSSANSKPNSLNHINLPFFPPIPISGGEDNEFVMFFPMEEKQQEKKEKARDLLSDKVKGNDRYVRLHSALDKEYGNKQGEIGIKQHPKESLRFHQTDHSSKAAEETQRTENEEHGFLHTVGNFFGAVGTGIKKAAGWIWEAIKSPFS